MFVTIIHAYNFTRNTATGLCPYYMMHGRRSRLSICVEFGLGKSEK